MNPDSQEREAGRRVLVFRSANVHQTGRALQRIKGRFPDARVTLLLPAHHLEYFSENPLIGTLRIYDTSKDGVWRTVLQLIKELRGQRFDLLVILSSPSLKVAHLYSIILFSLFIRAEQRILFDGEDHETDVIFTHTLKAVFDSAVFIIGSAFARLGTRILLMIYQRFKRESRWETRSNTSCACGTPPHPASPPFLGERIEVRGDFRTNTKNSARKQHRIGVLIPVLPDVSHTFVYREILGMKKNGADFVPIILEEGDSSPLHPEAKELLDIAIPMPRISLGLYILYYLHFLTASPLRLARLIHFYLSHCQGDRFSFLRFEHFQNVYHPMRSLALARLLKRLKISHIHAHGSTYPATRALASALLLDITFSFSTFVDFDYETDFRMLPEKIKQAEFVVATTEYCVSRILAATSPEFRPKIHTIYLSIDPAYANTRNPRARPSMPLVLGIGRFVEKKGFEYLLRAAALLKGRGVSFRCMLIGEGPERAELEALAEHLHLGGIVEFAGALSNDRVRDYLRAPNVLAAPSVYARNGERDGIPTVLVEAMACGVPVVSTRVSGIPELISNEENGLLVPERDEVALAAAIERLLTDATLRDRVTEEGRRTVHSQLDIHQSSRKLWSLIEAASAPPTILP